MLPFTSMANAAPKASYADIEALPEHVTGELIDGVLHTQARPAGPHLSVGLGLAAWLDSSFGSGPGAPGVWIFFMEPELHLGDDVLVPDIAGWKVERLSLENRVRASFDVAPDWVCEIASPSTSMHDRRVKAPAYARHGIGHLWLVEPVDGRVEVFERLDSRWVVVGAWDHDADARIPPFDSVPLDLAHLWNRLGPRR